MLQAEVSDAVLEHGASQARVLMLTASGEQIDCHIDGLGGGAVHVVQSTPAGRVKRKVPLTAVTDIAAFLEDDDLADAAELTASLDDLTKNLRAAAEAVKGLPLAAQILHERGDVEG